MRSSYVRAMHSGDKSTQLLPILGQHNMMVSPPVLRNQRTRVKRSRHVSQSIRQDFCFRLIVGLITLQLFILVLVILFVGDNFQQVFISREQTLRLLEDYYGRLLRHHVQKDDVPMGIVLDDDYTSEHAPDGKAATDVDVAGGDDDLHELEDNIANRTVERLDQAERQQKLQIADEHEESLASFSHLPPMDNYYERQLHQDRKNDTPFEFLIIGGSDGSGTRAFVTALGKLGVPMIVDDR